MLLPSGIAYQGLLISTLAWNDKLQYISYIPYSGKFGEGIVWWIYSFRAFGKNVLQINKTSKGLLIVSNNLDDFSLENHRQFAEFAKLFPSQTFLLYGKRPCSYSIYVSYLCHGCSALEPNIGSHSTKKNISIYVHT